MKDARVLTKIVEGPKSPFPTAGLDGLDIVVNPSVWNRAALVRDLKSFEQSGETHRIFATGSECSGVSRVWKQIKNSRTTRQRC